MGYEEYLRVLVRLDRPNTWWPVVSLALEMKKKRRLVSAYMTRLHKMGLVKRRLYRGAGRGRPGYAYRLSLRGREHAAWLRNVYRHELESKMTHLAARDPRSITWTPVLDAEVLRFLRRQEPGLEKRLWITLLSAKRYEVLHDPMSLFIFQEWHQRGRRRSR